MLSSWQIILLNMFFWTEYSDILSPVPIVFKITAFVEQWIYVLLCFCISPFCWLPVVCMSQLSLEEPDKAPVNWREHAAFLHMKISRRYIKGGISCRWVDFIAINVLSCSFIQRMYCFKTDTCHENAL